ncbi:MAG: phospho-N-acetylmuramoyl-pentapeptide-transferase [Clostridiales bacterium]|nr:phospho-N-acetylmuramoyl-pentapeptide-transferase [Clostridiales bacterium]
MPDYLIASFAALAVAVICIPLLIPALRKLGLGQYVRAEGPESHLAKSGTPTMGGLVFLLALPVAMVASGGVTAEGMLPLLLAAAMGLLGFADDFLKIRNHHSEGLTARQKMAGQLAISFIFAAVLWRMEGGSVWLPLVDRHYQLGIFYIPLAMLVITATVNGVNFTDGLDGLCSGVTFLIAVAFLLLCRAWGMTGPALFAGGLAGSCLGFLLFNLHPAKVFMGDTGALALGGGVAALALLTGTELLLPLLGIIYVVEVGSVILQVGYFRLTGGKRLFRMSPLHHHFELGGWNEGRVDAVFWLATLIAALAFLWIML